PELLAHLNDDRIGRSLDRLFDCDLESLVLLVVTHAVREFGVSLDELHNDSTTITFHGAYTEAVADAKMRGRTTPAITWGHNKDHRPDLKQLLYILTVARDGAIPVQFRVQSGNVTDDTTHRATWDLLCRLTGTRDFLYVADCKLATAENMAYLHQHGGRFLSVLPRTRAEDREFRQTVARDGVRWRPIHDKLDDDGHLIDRFSVCEPEVSSVEGYRLVWYHSTRKAEVDAQVRLRRVARAEGELSGLKVRLNAVRTRFRQRAKVEEAVAAILGPHDVARWITVTIEERTEESYRQEGRGRPNENTRYIKATSTRFTMDFQVDYAGLNAERSGDGIFPLVTNARSLSERELLLAYKCQAGIEKRFSNLKTDFEVAPVYLKNVGRIEGLLCVYFFALLTEALLERELRRSMKRSEVGSLPLYPEARPSARPTARRIIDLFEEVQRHELIGGEEAPVVFTTELSPLQRRLLSLLRMTAAYNR
ncbi:IS1634 family transposase, partial [Singulisphaera rosea]